MNDLKTTMRRHALARRDLVTQREAHDAAAAMCASALALVEELSTAGSAPVVSVYWPIRSELNTRPLIETLSGRGLKVALPILVAVKRPLLFRAFVPGDELAKGPFGLSEPSADKAALEPDIIFAPLAAFDRKGYRLGYGGGLYDATLNALRAKHPVTAIGIAYAVQEADSIPIEDHDQKLDFIVTERETIRCA
jgi:5-formyltetrahydrofolate cyclo-ligase